MRIIGIDPGSRFTGYGIIDSQGSKHSYVAGGFIKVSGDTLVDKLGCIFREVSGLIETFSPAEMAIEQVFVNKNVDSALKLGQARGAAICAAAQFDLPVGEYAPRDIKKSVVGSGAADKQQIQQMMKMLLKLDTLPQSDMADALAIAMTHAHQRHSKIPTTTAKTSRRRSNKRWTSL